MQEIVTEFIAFVTSEACDKATEKNRTTITNDDVLEALKELGFDHYHYECALLNQSLNKIKSKREQAVDKQNDENNPAALTPSDNEEGGNQVEVEEFLGGDLEDQSSDQK